MGCLTVETAVENKSLAALSNCSITKGVPLIFWFYREFGY